MKCTGNLISVLLFLVMTRYLLCLLFFMSALVGLTQSKMAKPNMGQVDGTVALAPGTIKVEVSPLHQIWKDDSCKQEMKQMPVKVIQVIGLGSGLVNSLSAGDSLIVRMMVGMHFSLDSLEEKTTLLLKEQLCSFEKTYYTFIRKE